MPENLIALGEALKSGSSHQRIQSCLTVVLKQMLDCPINTKKIWHPLGFLMIKLGSISENEILRLHIWSDEIRSTQKPAWLIHNHIWILKSHILCGRLTNQFYKVTPNEYVAINKIYKVRYAADKSILIATNNLVTVAPSNRKEFTKGDTYCIEPGEFHSTEVSENQFTSTIVLASSVELSVANKIENLEPEVIGDLQGNNQYSYHRMACDNNQFTKLIKILLSKI